MTKTKRLCVNCDHYKVCTKYDLANYNDKIAENCSSFANYNVLFNLIGKVVYGISRNKNIPITIESVKFSEKEIILFGKNEEYFGNSNIHLDPYNKIGMEWYLSEEDAKKTLEGK